jgi:hypothetical protein
MYSTRKTVSRLLERSMSPDPYLIRKDMERMKIVVCGKEDWEETHELPFREQR